MAIQYGDGTTSNTGRIIRIIQQTHTSEATSSGISNWANAPFPTLVVTPESTSSKFLLMCFLVTASTAQHHVLLGGDVTVQPLALAQTQLL